MLDQKLEFDRRDFLQLATWTAAAGIGTTLPAATAAEGEATDFTRWLDSISGKQKIVLDVREPNEGLAMAWAWVYLLTGKQAYGVKENDLATVMVFRHNAIPLVLEDSAWRKYKLGEFFKIEDPESKAPAVRNPFYVKGHEPLLPDMALQKLIDRGVKVAACDMAIHFYSALVANQAGLKHDDVEREWMAGVLPGIMHAPSGVVALQGAVARGCSYIFAG
jgi:hypothetical protein